ncbi:MAG: hypothetical protein GXO76_08700 [Calditrichaeota bacterium]|nr:hypothetical protein [Calditrichota bacterium]
MTERLYYTNSYQTEFEASVEETRRDGDRTFVRLDKTAFYPTSGGQMHDTGWLNDTPVVDVVEQEGLIWHALAGKWSGKSVSGKINWERRFDFMQQHTGFHLLAGAFLHHLKIETLSSHLGEEISTIDVKTDRISLDEVAGVENLANRIIAENRTVKAFFVEPGELSHLPLRKEPEVPGKIRLVEIDDFDLDPCGGTHVGRTGEVQLVKIVRWEKLRGNVRLFFYAGRRAIRHYRLLWHITRNLNQELTAGEEDLLARVKDLKTDVKAQKKEIQRLKEFWAQQQALALADHAKKTGQPFVLHVFDSVDFTDAKQVAQNLVREANLSTAVFVRMKDAWRLILARPETEAINFREWLDDIRVLQPVKGGGRPSWVEILGENGMDEIVRLIEINFKKGKN